MIDSVPPARHRGAPAFTLAEMPVAMTVLALLSTVLFGLLNSVNQVWARAQAHIIPNRNGRVVLDLIARDLRPAALPADRSNVTNSLQFLINPPQVDISYCNPQAFFWQAPIATDTTYGNMAEVGYFVRWDTTTRPGYSFAQLCRFFVNPQPPANASDYLIYPPSGGLTSPAWVTGTLLDHLAPATAASNYKGWVADNVLALWTRALDVNGQAITVTANTVPANPDRASDLYAYDSRQGYTSYATDEVTKTIKEGINVNGAITPIATLPASVEIVIFTTDALTANRISTDLRPSVLNSNLGKDPTKFWQDINTYRFALPSSVQKPS